MQSHTQNCTHCARLTGAFKEVLKKVKCLTKTVKDTIIKCAFPSKICG